MKNLGAVQFHEGSLVLGNDPLVIGEFGVDETHLQDDAVLLQHAHSLLHSEFDGPLLVFDEPTNLRDSLPRDDHALVEFHDLFHLRVSAHNGEPVPVGRDHPQDERARLLLFRLHVNTVEIDPRFVRRHGEVGLLDHVADHGTVDAYKSDLLVIHDLRKLLCGDSGDPEVDFSAVDYDPVRVLLPEVHLFSLDLPEHLVEFSGRQRDLAIPGNLRLVIRNETDLPVRRHDADPIGFCPDENVVQHRHRRTPVHNPQGSLNTAQENVTPHTEFHKPVSFPSLGFRWFPPGPVPFPKSNSSYYPLTK